MSFLCFMMKSMSQKIKINHATAYLRCFGTVSRIFFISHKFYSKVMSAVEFKYLTLYLLMATFVVSAHSPCKQFVPRSGLTERIKKLMDLHSF